MGLTEKVSTLGLQAARKNHCLAVKRRARKAKVGIPSANSLGRHKAAKSRLRRSSVHK